MNVYRRPPSGGKGAASSKLQAQANVATVASPSSRHQQSLASARLQQDASVCARSSRAERGAGFHQHNASSRSSFVPLNVFAPAQETVDSATSSDSSLDIPASPIQLPHIPPVSIAAIVAPVAADMQQMNANLRSIAGDRDPALQAAADQIFAAGGKKLRPMIVFLIARATAALAGLSDLTAEQRRLAEITEMIHTASLVHDDVLDECSVRRGVATVNAKYGTRTAVMLGDFLFAQSSWFLANLNNLEVIKLISQVIADFADGEIRQMGRIFDTDLTMKDYMDKSFYKTASLIAASCRSAAVFGGVDASVKDAMFEYGRHLGLAFQVVDDILDFTQTTEQLGKPQGQDLASGNLTAPALYALNSPAVGRELQALIDGEFTGDGGLSRALQLVVDGGGIEDAMVLARREGDMALECLNCLKDCEAKRSLELMVDYVLKRIS